MPEGPEIQALSERMHAKFGSGELRSLNLLHFSVLKTIAPSPEEIVGQELQAVSHRGKFLTLAFESARCAIHLGQGGRIDFESPVKSTKPKGALARFVFNDDAMLLREYGTERKAGVWILATDDDGPLGALGPEAGSDEFARFILVGQGKRRLTTILRDQKTVAGLGRGHTDDVLHRAKVSPFATLASLSGSRREDLVRAVGIVLGAALELERQRVGGLPAKLDNRFRVHGKFAQPCPDCGAKLERVSYDGYEMVYCPPCQTDGKKLADRRLSLLLK